jgi:hypothetical protein
MSALDFKKVLQKPLVAVSLALRDSIESDVPTPRWTSQRATRKAQPIL